MKKIYVTHLSTTLVPSMAVFHSFPFLLIILFQSLIESSCSENLYHTQIPRKCCSFGQVFNNQFICINKTSSNKTNIFIKNKRESTFQCPNNQSMIFVQKYETTNLKFYVPDNTCIDEAINGTMLVAKCSNQHSTGILGMGAVVFWGAKIYMSTNLVHVTLGLVVIVVYLSVPERGRGLYSRAVVQHNICHMMQGIILQFLSGCELNDYHISDNMMIFFWLCLQYFTIATVFWLNNICFDITLSITRFRWMPGNNFTGQSRKLYIYGIVGWTGPLIPVLIAGVCECMPQVSNNFFLKPHYLNFRNGPSVIVNMYFFLLPMFTLLLNNILFVFTTWKIIEIQRSTKIATKNRDNILKKNYFLFLNLYLLMGAPWYFGMLFACLNRLFVLKVCRLVQPIVWLLMLMTRMNIGNKIKNLLSKYKSNNFHEENSDIPTSDVAHTDKSNPSCKNIP